MNVTETFIDKIGGMIGKEEFRLFGWIAVGILILLIITCCIGCKGCCCRACCGSRETRASLYMCKVPKSNNKSVAFPNEITMLPMTRCCHHPHHCVIDIETPKVCYCRQICASCNQYIPRNNYYGFDQSQGHLEFAPGKGRKGKLCNVEKETTTGTIGPQLVEVDTACNPGSSAKTVYNRGKQAPVPPPKPEIGFNYRPPPSAWSYTGPTPHPNAPAASQMGVKETEPNKTEANNEESDWQ